MTGPPGYRGYIASRPLRGVSTPQRVQNLVIRDYAARRGLRYLLSMAEYAMPGSFMMLENIFTEIGQIEGIIAFSAFMLPADRAVRLGIYRRLADAGAEFHAALENVSVATERDVARLEDLICSAYALERAPLRGRYEKSNAALIESDDPFVRALRPVVETAFPSEGQYRSSPSR